MRAVQLGLGKDEGSGDLGADLVRKAAASFPDLSDGTDDVSSNLNRGVSALTDSVSKVTDNQAGIVNSTKASVSAEGGNPFLSAISNVANSITGSGGGTNDAVESAKGGVGKAASTVKQEANAASVAISNAVDDLPGKGSSNLKEAGLRKEPANAAGAGMSSAIDNLVGKGSASKTDLSKEGGNAGLVDVKADTNTSFGGYEGDNQGVADPRNSEITSTIPTNTTNRDNRNLGPNEVGQDFIRSLPYASETDAAAPGGLPRSFVVLPLPSIWAVAPRVRVILHALCTC